VVIGNGMVAKAFSKYSTDENIIIFASGVSNSKEQRSEEFEREFLLLSNVINDNKKSKFIYFSTCSIFDKQVSETPYVVHKKEVEDYIKKNCQNYIIFRLPTVIGSSKNDKTLFNNFKNKILNSEVMEIQKNSFRFLIDIEDLSYILPFFIENVLIKNQTINVSFNNKILVKDIVRLYEIILGRKSNVVLVDSENDFHFSNEFFINELNKINYQLKENYNYNLLKKYLK
jgi:nucleoside-diphosphate-sugar epimerase